MDAQRMHWLPHIWGEEGWLSPKRVAWGWALGPLGGGGPLKWFAVGDCLTKLLVSPRPASVAFAKAGLSGDQNRSPHPFVREVCWSSPDCINAFPERGTCNSFQYLFFSDLHRVVLVR